MGTDDNKSGLMKIKDWFNVGGTRPYLLVLTILNGLYFIAQSTTVVILYWDDINLRVGSLEDFERYSYMLAVEVWFFLKSDNLQNLLRVVEGAFYDYGENTTAGKRFVVESGRKGMELGTVKLSRLMGFLTINIVTAPLFVAGYLAVTNPLEPIPYSLLLPSECWFPFPVSNFALYSLLYLHSCFYYAAINYLITLHLGGIIGGMHRITTDIRLLRTALMEIDLMSGNCNLDKYMGQLVHHHKTIHSNVELITSGISFASLNLNKTAVLMGCLNLYCFLELEGIPKIKGLFSTMFLAIIVYGYMSIGQTVKNEGEELRKNLYECSWLDKPLWFKKSIYTMMIRETKTTQMKPLLYAINLDTFASICNAAYAYCNFLRITKQKLTTTT